jgi:hypothetical protein
MYNIIGYGPRHDKVMMKLVRTKMTIVESTLIRFDLDCGRYPDDSEGLQALLESPADIEEKWKGRILSEVICLTSGKIYFLCGRG